MNATIGGTRRGDVSLMSAKGSVRVKKEKNRLRTSKGQFICVHDMCARVWAW